MLIIDSITSRIVQDFSLEQLIQWTKEMRVYNTSWHCKI